METYRLFVKDCLNLKGRPKAVLQVLSFNISRDLLEKASSSFTIKGDIEEIYDGDVVGLIDPYGSIIYNGVIDSISKNPISVDNPVNSETTITSNQMAALFDDNWRYWVPTSVSTIEQALRDIINFDFKSSYDPVMAAKYDFTIKVNSKTTGMLPIQDDNTVYNFEEFIYKMYNDYGIVFTFDISFEASTPVLTIEKPSLNTMKVANNSVAIRELSVETEVADTNKLIVYSEDGLTLRGIYYVDSNGITANASSSTRSSIVKTEYVFSDDDLVAIILENLNTAMYNHYISFDLVNASSLYDSAWSKWELTQPIDVWINGVEYNTIYTGYEYSQDIDSPSAIVSIKCGKVRANLTSKILSIFGKKVKNKAGKAIPLDWIYGLFEE